ncbi:MAG TPA: sigma-E factor regulatory protein RseB domain-containing protein [bacterium]|nr:sigma-E factor regulatory protein RseB domain-containing protein [bacterium]
MRRPASRALAAAVVLLIAGTAPAFPAAPPSPAASGAATPSTRAILTMALDAPKLIDYEGTKIISALRNGQMETVTVAESHKRPNLLRLEYLSPEDVAGRLIVDDGKIAHHYEPALNMVFEDRSIQDGGTGSSLTLLTRNYDIVLLGTDEVIGRQAYVLSLTPHRTGVQRQLWVDRLTGTVLREEDRDASRGLVLSTYFSRISFSLNLPQAYFRFRPPAGARVVAFQTMEGGGLSPAELQQKVGFPVLVPPALPEGYTFRGGAVSRFGSLVSAYLRYSDGGNIISFFEAPAGSIGWPSLGVPVRVQSQPGRFIDLGYLRVLIWEQRGLRITAVGTAPSETLMLVAGQLIAGREEAMVTDVSLRAAADPAVVRRLRGQGLTFSEIARTLAISHALGTSVDTTVRFVRGSLSVADLAAQLRLQPDALRAAVRRAVDGASMTPALPASAPDGPARPATP